MLSINDLPASREVFKRFYLPRVEASYAICEEAGARRRVGELIVTQAAIKL